MDLNLSGYELSLVILAGFGLVFAITVVLLDTYRVDRGSWLVVGIVVMALCALGAITTINVGPLAPNYKVSSGVPLNGQDLNGLMQRVGSQPGDPDVAHITP